jgi:Tol biopolymer transport system component
MVVKCIFFGLARLVSAKMALLAASIAFLVMLASCGTQPAGTGPTTKPASSSHNGKIAFVRWDNRVGKFDIFVMKADGTGARKLATGPTQANNPVWSPNGKRLAFEAVPRGGSSEFNTDIYVMNADGSGLKRITQEPTLDSMPSWSPESMRIAFSMVDTSLSSASASYSAISSQENSNENGIYTIRVDGTSLRQLTHEVEDVDSAWSPDGKTIAFGRQTKHAGGLYQVNSDGGGLRQLTDPPKGFSDRQPSWSPDGTKIAFTRGSDGGRADVFLISADGTHIRKLTGKTDSSSPDFAPDGKKIVFVGYKGGDKLYVMNTDGTNVRRLTKTQAAIYEAAPDWQPLP